MAARQCAILSAKGSRYASGSAPGGKLSGSLDWSPSISLGADEGAAYGLIKVGQPSYSKYRVEVDVEYYYVLQIPFAAQFLCNAQKALGRTEPPVSNPEIVWVIKRKGACAGPWLK